MDFLKRPPDWLVNRVPGGMRGYVQGMFWYIILGGAAVIALIVLYYLARSFLRRFMPGRYEATEGKRLEAPLEEHLDEYPAPKPSTGDRQLKVEGVPVRLRLVAVAPAGKADEVNEEDVPAMLERVVPGLGEIFRGDEPEVRIWPFQVSYQGFAKHFHRNTIIPEEEGEPTPWVILAGRVKLGKQQIMLGLALVAIKPTTIRRRTLDAHEWASALRVRVRD